MRRRSLRRWPALLAAVRRRGGNRIIDPADGKIPYKPEARAKQQDILQHHMADEPELHCYQSGVPHSESNQFGVQIIQTPGYFVQLSEFMHTVRIIPTDGRAHIDPKIKLFQGDPVGHWEGDTLVVDTTNQNTRTWFDTSGNFKTDALHVTEKFIPQDANTIIYEATVTDPTIYTQPWTARWNIGRNRQTTMSDGHPYEQMEFGCIEGNRICSTTPRTRAAKRPRNVKLLADHVYDVPIVLGTNKLVDVFGRREIRNSLRRIRFGQHSGVFHGDFGFEMPQIGSPVSLHYVELFRMRMRLLIEPGLSLKPIRSTTSVSPSQCPTLCPYHAGIGSFG